MNLRAILAGFFRTFIADYGVPVMIVLWTALSYSVPHRLPSGLPRRLIGALPWESESLHHWTVVKVLIRHKIRTDFKLIQAVVIFRTENEFEAVE